MAEVRLAVIRAAHTPSPRAFEKRRISDLDVTRARMVHRAWYALRLAIGVMLGGASFPDDRRVVGPARVRAQHRSHAVLPGLYQLAGFRSAP